MLYNTILISYKEKQFEQWLKPFLLYFSIIPTDGNIAKLPHFGRDQLFLTKLLGRGAFGEVLEGIAKNIISDSSGETKVAVKVCLWYFKLFIWFQYRYSEMTFNEKRTMLNSEWNEHINYILSHVLQGYFL